MIVAVDVGLQLLYLGLYLVFAVTLSWKDIPECRTSWNGPTWVLHQNILGDILMKNPCTPVPVMLCILVTSSFEEAL